MATHRLINVDVQSEPNNWKKKKLFFFSSKKKNDNYYFPQLFTTPFGVGGNYSALYGIDNVPNRMLNDHASRLIDEATVILAWYDFYACFSNDCLITIGCCDNDDGADNEKCKKKTDFFKISINVELMPLSMLLKWKSKRFLSNWVLDSCENRTNC